VRLIGVIDVMRGVAVHAAGGDRARYEPVSSVAGLSIPRGDALALAREYMALGIDEIYVADLDAIAGNRMGGDGLGPVRARAQPPHHQELISELARLGLPLWLDAGIASVSAAEAALVSGASYVIVGLETLRSFNALGEISDSIDAGRVAFSLDLRAGMPVTHQFAGEPVFRSSPSTIASRAVDAGAAVVIVIDLARVGSRTGLDLELLTDIRNAIHRVPLIAGGGIRGLSDCLQLAQTGCDGALVATMLLNGGLDRDGIRRIAALDQISASR
jgi:phosphoribosylformimino-5-aminoimidazole carboxamide ribotide isomerase